MDYMDIVNRKRVGLWNVPFVRSAYLIKGSLINYPPSPNQVSDFTSDSGLEPDMSFCANLRDAGVFMHTLNRWEFGHLVHADAFKTDHLHNELWEMVTNRWDWEKRYLHPNYSGNFAEDAVLEEPCPLVYWFPIISHRFADDFVAEMENYGKWSHGSHKVGEQKVLTTVVPQFCSMLLVVGH